MATLIKPQEVINGGIYRQTPISARFDAQLIAPQIGVAELRFVMPIVCREMYDDMIGKQNASVANYNPNTPPLVAKFPSDANYEALWTDGKLGELCARAVYYVSLPYIAFQTGSNGVYEMQAEYTRSASKEVKFLQDTELQSIQTLQQFVSDYLCQNSADYSLYPADEKCKNVSGCDECGGLDSESNKDKNERSLRKITGFV